MTLRIGELFAGYGGLGMGVQAVLGGEVAWFSEFDAAPSKILQHHWPDKPNLGDITLIDWSTVPPVDILTGGFPCQDVSLAGARRGLKEGTRSGLWSEFARAIAALQPEMVVIENVRGLLSATAGGSMEPDPWGVGDGATRPVINALGAVLGDLADLGYDTKWCGLRAADAGAPHGRYRIFIVAHRAGERRGEGWAESARRERRPAVEFGGALVASDASSDEPKRRRGAGELGSTQAASEADGEERQRVRDAVGYCCSATTNADNTGRGEQWGAKSIRPKLASAEHARDDASWGDYAPAVARWEEVMGRIAPDPTNPDGKNGSHRLSAQFVEWMMGLPAGHVTETGLTRNEQLKALGNGVVWQQAALALRVLLERRTA